MKRVHASHSEELSELKMRFTRLDRRGAGRRIPVSLRRAVVSLHNKGVPVRILATAVKVSAGQIYAWVKMYGATTPAPNVFDIAPAVVPALSPSSADGSLKLQWGCWEITISVRS